MKAIPKANSEGYKCYGAKLRNWRFWAQKISYDRSFGPVYVEDVILTKSLNVFWRRFYRSSMLSFRNSMCDSFCQKMCQHVCPPEHILLVEGRCVLDNLRNPRRPGVCTCKMIKQIMQEYFLDGLTGVRRPRKSTWEFIYTGRIQLGAGAQFLLLIHENAAVVCRTRLEPTSRFCACGLMWWLLLHAGKTKEGEKSPKNLKTWTVNRSLANWRDPPSGISEW